MDSISTRLLNRFVYPCWPFAIEVPKYFLRMVNQVRISQTPRDFISYQKRMENLAKDLNQICPANQRIKKIVTSFLGRIQEARSQKEVQKAVNAFKRAVFLWHPLYYQQRQTKIVPFTSPAPHTPRTLLAPIPESQVESSRTVCDP